MVYNDVIGRAQIYLGDDELAVLDDRARATGASRSELIRRAVRATFGPDAPAGPAPVGGDPVSCVEIHFTVDEVGTADRMVDSLLADRLVACGQRSGPLVSRYWWQGTTEQAEEWLVVLKTRADLSATVVDAVAGMHPYRTPEVVVFDIAGGSPAYLGWVAEVTVGAGAWATGRPIPSDRLHETGER